VETFFGSTGSDGYFHVAGYEKLRAHFVETLCSNLPAKFSELKSAIRLAELSGILHRYLEGRPDAEDISEQEIAALEARLAER
jgi:hypothetical protein